MKKFYLLAAIVVAGLLVGCTNDDLFDQSKYEMYASNFKEHFGRIDEGHNFNMVRGVDITTDADLYNYTLLVYDKVPNCGLGAHLLGEFQNLSGGSEVRCDVPRNVSKLYFAYQHDGLTQYSTSEVTPDDKAMAKLSVGGTRADAPAFTKSQFFSTFSIYHYDAQDRHDYPQNTNINIPKTEDPHPDEHCFKNPNDDKYYIFDQRDLTQESTDPQKRWGVFSKDFYDMLQGTATDGTYNGVLPFNLFAHAEDHTAFTSDFTFEYDESAAQGGVDYITFYPIEYEAGRHDIVGYYIYDIETGAIKEKHNIWENYYDGDRFRLAGNDQDLHYHYDPNFLAVATGSADIDGTTVTAQNFTPTDYLPFPARYFTLDTYVTNEGGNTPLTRYRVTNTQDSNGVGISMGRNEDGTISGVKFSDMGWVPTWDDSKVNFDFAKHTATNEDAERFVYEFKNNTGLASSTFSFLKTIKLPQGFYKMEADGFSRHGTSIIDNNERFQTYARLVAQGAKCMTAENSTSTVSYLDMTNYWSLTPGDGENLPTQLYVHNNNGNYSSTYANWWFNQGRCRNTLYFYLDNSEHGHSQSNVTIGIQGGFRDGKDSSTSLDGSWVAGGNITLTRMYTRRQRSDCKAVLGQPCTVGLNPGEGMGFYITARSYNDASQVETGELDVTEGAPYSGPAIAEGNTRRSSASLKSTVTRDNYDENGMVTYYSEAARNPDNSPQCVYAELKFKEEETTGSETSTSSTTQYGIVGLEDWGLTEESESDKDYNDIMILVEHKVKNEADKDIVYTLAYEDLGTTDDFDFNDLVLQVKHVSGSNTAKLRLKCAGGHMPLSVNFGEQVIWESVKSGAYGLNGTFDKTNSVTGETNTYSADQVIVNTNADTYSPALSLQYPNREISFDPVAQIDVPSGFLISDNASEFNIVVTYDDGVSTNDKIRIRPLGSDDDPDRTPQVIVLVTDSWLWPKERADIGIAYPDFMEWVQDKTKLEWLNNKVSEHLYDGLFDKTVPDNFW